MSIPELWISTAKHRESKSWKNEKITWDELVKRLSVAVRTPETFAEYEAMTKPQKAEKKDVGGFVGGVIRGGRRLARSISSRSLVTLDIDHATADFWPEFTLRYPCAAFMYATHSHSPEKPRLRLIMPLDREVMVDEYEAIARAVAGSLGIELFDPTTFQPERLMYWPSTPTDVPYYSACQVGPPLGANAVLSTYHDWKDAAQWPVSVKVLDGVRKAAQKQEDPLEKTGVIGAFCRTYTISEVITAYLSDVYAPTDHPERFTYANGSTASGLVVYEDKFAYSHHGTDPAGNGHLHNAFDLVRVHLYGMMDEDCQPTTPINKRPSFIAMQDRALKDESVSHLLSVEKIKDAGLVFDGSADGLIDLSGDDPFAATDWLKDLQKDRKGNILSTIDNVYIIIKNDPNLAGSFAYDEFRNQEVLLRNVPWRDIRRSPELFTDDDEAGLRHYVEKFYGISSSPKVTDGLRRVFIDYRLHPIKDYFTRIQWDGNPRLDTLLIDYFGAEDCDYTRFVTRKAFVSGVARVMDPGCKFDNMLVLVSDEGKNKSSFLEKIGMQWFTADFGPLDNMKVAIEQLQGSWIIEVAELAGIKKADIETVKHFVSKTRDRMRKAYGKRVEDFPRQCIFIGTTNKSAFITDIGRNRRFWPVVLTVTEPTRDVWLDLTVGEVSQIWAEAYERWEAGEPRYLSQDEEEIANKVRDGHREEDDRNELIRRYLEVLLPEDWETMDRFSRVEYMQDEGRQSIEGVEPRERVTPIDIWIDVFNGREKDATPYNMKFIRDYLDRSPQWVARVLKDRGKAVRGYTRAVTNG